MATVIIIQLAEITYITRFESPTVHQNMMRGKYTA